MVFGEWAMVNGENLIILLLLNYYANSSSTLSVIHFSVIHYPPALLNSHPSPPQPAGLRNCNAAAFAPF
jgi:hypothetical protein